ncbi:tRNA lysidine(34) synthetase TilS [Bacteroidota bacterium]
MKTDRSKPALEPRVLHFIQEHQLVCKGETLLLAVSGGPDSVCLFHILLQLKDKLGIELHVAHLNHQLRGADSEADAHYVAELAYHLGIPATIEQRDVSSFQMEHRLSPEEAAREVRYAYLAEVARDIGASRVAVGHTIDDHIETILMHIVRGSGTRGLRGLQLRTEQQFQGNGLTVVRPLLSVKRAETTGYCHHHQLKPRIDTSNLSLSHLRNSIRLELLPLMQSYNADISEALLRLGQIAHDDLDFIHEEGQKQWGKVTQEHEDTIVLEKEPFLKLPLAIKRHMLRLAIEKLIGNLKDIETRHIEQLLGSLNKPAGRKISLPEGLSFIIEYDRFLLSMDPSALSPFPALNGEHSIKIPGETHLPGWQIEADIITREQIDREDDGFTAFLDLKKTGDGLTIRPRKRGDRFQPLGMAQQKKTGEFMIDARIPQAWRGRIPIVCSPTQIVWIAGWRIDDRMKVTESTQEVLRLKMSRDNT